MGKHVLRKKNCGKGVPGDFERGAPTSAGQSKNRQAENCFKSQQQGHNEWESTSYAKQFVVRGSQGLLKGGGRAPTSAGQSKFRQAENCFKPQHQVHNEWESTSYAKKIVVRGSQGILKGGLQLVRGSRKIDRLKIASNHSNRVTMNWKARLTQNFLW